MKEKGTEVFIFVFGAIGLVVLFTLLYGIPRFVFNHVWSFISTMLR